MAALSESPARPAGAGRFDYDVLVVGSGFGGSVTALRLTEKGYTVGVLEAGRRFADDEFAKTSWDVRRFVFAPALGCHGILRISLLKDIMIMSGAGVGGGSLVYANTLYEPPDAFFTDSHWAHITDWKSELAPYYDQAQRMLGVVENPVETASDRVLKQVADEIGVGQTYRLTPVGVLFDDPDGSAPPASGEAATTNAATTNAAATNGATTNGAATDSAATDSAGPAGGAARTPPGTPVRDPFFGGTGPVRTTCTLCGQCMVGCRQGAKNTLVKNYLYLAEQSGATVHPMTTAKTVRPLPGGGYAVDTVRTGTRRKDARTFTAEQVVFAAAALGTQKLLHRMRDEGHLPNLSGRLGELSRTNSEAILGSRSRRKGADYSGGVAITSSIHPDSQTHIEPVRYGPGSNLLALLTGFLVDGDEPGNVHRLPRWIRVFAAIAAHWRDLPKVLPPRRWSQQSIILLAMQTKDNSVTTYTKRGPFGRHMTTKQGIGEPNPSWIPVAHDVSRKVAEKTDGVPMGAWTELFDRPLTAHFIGGCPIGDSPGSGVIDPYQRIYGHPGLHVADGAAVAANLGVNPSLTITAQAERAMSFWPNQGEADPRPALGEAYRRLAPVAPRSPVVPDGAPAALRLHLRPAPGQPG